MRCGLYIRVSTEMQRDMGESLEVQRRRLRAKIREKGWEEVRLYRDAGISAKDTSRPEFQAMVADIERGEIEAVICTKLDRMFRSTRDFLETTEFFDNHGVKFVCLDEDIDTSTANGRAFSTVRAAFAQFERETTAERVREVMLERAKQGKWNGGPVPFGFRREGEGLQIDKHESHVVRELFRLFLEKRSKKGTVALANRMGLRTRRGGLWAVSSLSRLLTNRVYVGDLVYNRRRGHRRTTRKNPEERHIRVPGVLPSIVSRTEFDAVQKALADIHWLPPAVKGSDHLLSGLVQCGICGSGMYGNSHPARPDRWRYYRCSERQAKGPLACQGSSMNAVAIEKAILAALRQVALKPRELSQMAEEQHETLDREQRPLRNEKRKLERSHRRASEEKARLVDLLVREIVSESDFRTQRDKLDGRIARIQERLQDIESRLTRPGFEDYDLERLVASLGSLKGVYEELTTEERKQLLRTVISRVVIKGRGRNAQVDMALSCLPRFCHYDRIPRRADPLDWPGTVLTALPSGRGGGWRLWIGSPWRGAGGREWGSRAWECRQGTAARVVP